MISLSDLARVQGRPAYDSSGEPLGTVDQIYMSDFSDEPRWVTVTGAPGSAAQLFAPVAGARVSDDGLRLAWSRDDVLASPQVAADEHIDAAAETRLSEHYGSVRSSTEGRPADEHDQTPGEDADVAGEDRPMTLSGERAVPGTEQITRRLRLRRYVVTDVETVEVPLKRERLAIERVSDVDGTTHVVDEFTLREERIVEVRTETVAVEDVRIAKTVVEEEEQVAVEMARERLDAEGAVIDRGAATDS